MGKFLQINQNILRQLKTFGPLPLGQIAREYGLSRPEALTLVEQLQLDGVLELQADDTVKLTLAKPAEVLTTKYIHIRE